MMAIFVMAMRNDHYFLVGPFPSHEDAGAWGAAHNDLDDPRWQTIRLADPGACPPVYAPDTDVAVHAMSTP